MGRNVGTRWREEPVEGHARDGRHTPSTKGEPMTPMLVPGSAIPDFELPDHTGTPRRLSEIQQDDPMVLTLARGHYCPKEHQQHLELAAHQAKFEVAYTRL